MATLVTPVEHKVILHGVSWETYERLLNEHQESPGTHFIYDEGALEIMVLSRRHEEPNRDLAMLAQLDDRSVNNYTMMVSSILYFHRN